MYPASGSFEQDTHRVSAEVSVVDGQFATEPMTVVKQAEQQVSEEDLHYFFEQAISVRFNRVSESLSGARMWSIQRSETWQHSIIQVCLALLLILSGFDLMGLLVLYLR